MVDTFVEKVNSVTFDLNQQNFEELLKSTNLAKVMTHGIGLLNTFITTMENSQPTG